MNNNWNAIDISGLPCIYCGVLRATVKMHRHHSLEGKDKGIKAKETKLTNHLNDEVNCAPACDYCNRERIADNNWDVSFDYAVEIHGIERVMDWLNRWPEYYQTRPRWLELERKMTNRLRGVE